VGGRKKGGALRGRDHRGEEKEKSGKTCVEQKGEVRGTWKEEHGDRLRAHLEGVHS